MNIGLTELCLRLLRQSTDITYYGHASVNSDSDGLQLMMNKYKEVL